MRSEATPPPQPLLGDVVRTTLVIWVGVHFAFALGVGGTGGNPLALSSVVAVVLLLLVALIAHLDRKARGLALLLANLGFSPLGVAGVVLSVAGAAEAVLQAVVRLMT